MKLRHGEGVSTRDRRGAGDGGRVTMKETTEFGARRGGGGGDRPGWAEGWGLVVSVCACTEKSLVEGWVQPWRLPHV